jgi:hypothetical protein
VKPVIAVLWILSLALAVVLSRFADPDRADSEPSPTVDEAFGEFDPLRRAYLMSHALQNLDSDDLPELLRMLEDRNMGIVDEEVRLIMLAWARFDAPGAYEWAREMPGSWRESLVTHAMYAWAYHEGSAAMRAVEEMEDSEFKEQMKHNAIQGWLRGDDKQGVSEYIANYPDVRRRGRLYFLLAGEIVMAEGLDAGVRWVESLSDDMPNNLKLGAFNNVAKMLAGKDPVRAAEWYLEHRTHPYSAEALTGIARRWVQHHDRPAAFEWLLAMSSDGIRAGERGDAIAGGFRAWMQVDPEAAQAWLLSKLPNPALDPAIKEVFKRLLPTDPGASMAWVQRLDDEDERHAQSGRVGIRWRGKDPEAFDDWLKENDLPEEIRQRILGAPAPAPRGARENARPKPAAAGKP